MKSAVSLTDRLSVVLPMTSWLVVLVGEPGSLLLVEVFFQGLSVCTPFVCLWHICCTVTGCPRKCSYLWLAGPLLKLTIASSTESVQENVDHSALVV